MKKTPATKTVLQNVVRISVVTAIFWGCGGGGIWAQDGSRTLSPISDRHWSLLVSHVVAGESDSIVLKEFAVRPTHLSSLRIVGELRELVLDGGVVEDTELEVIVQNCPKLEHLRLRHSPITDSGAERLAEMKQLRILNLPHSLLTAKGLKHLKLLENLQQLRLGGRQLDDHAVAVIAQFPELRSLHLIRPSLTDQALQDLAKSPKLASLYLDGCDLRPEAWQEITQKKPTLHIHLDQHHSD